MKLGAVRFGAIASLVAIATAAPLSAQSNGQSANDLRLPDPKPAEDARGVRVERDAGMKATCPFDDSPLKVTLSNVTFGDSRGGVLSDKLARSLAKVSVPQGEQPIRVICEVRDAANAALRADGWIASVQVPQQDLKGTLRLDVVSARLSEVRVNGNPGPYRDALSKVLGPLQQLDPLNERDAERILLKAFDIPGLKVRLSLAPSGEGPGIVVGNLAVEFERFAGVFNLRNYNARSIGRETAFARVDVHGITGLSDRTFIGGQTTFDFDEQLILQGGHEFGLGKSGTRLGAQFTYARARPTIQNLDLETVTKLGNIALTYPLVRTPLKASNISLGFDYLDQNTTVGIVDLSKDSLRTLYLRADTQGRRTRIDRSTWLAYSAFAEVRKGVDVFDATQFGGLFGFAETNGMSASRPYGNAEALVVRGGFDATAFLNETFDLRARVEGQWTDDPLLNFDEYSIGNLSIGRGYDPGANSGDRAIGFSGEAGVTVIDNPASRLRVQGFAFYDIIKLKNLDPFTPAPERTLASVGGGVRAYFGSGLTAEVTYAKPLDRALAIDAEKPPERVLFSLTTRFPALFR
ncbi:MAG: ShlB/FhaC/HecB family hemolysin secretion/activation protein [Porphyrobacter sp.]|nr:ShlB/FhaC/HecB family hemolysin secretion/activation protein [Porphyrobacter sp.]